jgi:hypothetical protein
MRGRYDIRRGFFNDAEAIEFQLTDNGRFAGARRPRNDEPAHLKAK